MLLFWPHFKGNSGWVCRPYFMALCKCVRVSAVQHVHFKAHIPGVHHGFAPQVSFSVLSSSLLKSGIILVVICLMHCLVVWNQTSETCAVMNCERCYDDLFGEYCSVGPSKRCRANLVFTESGGNIWNLSWEMFHQVHLLRVLFEPFGSRRSCPLTFTKSLSLKAGSCRE